MNWISNRRLKEGMHKLSVLLLTNNISLVYKNGKFRVCFFMFGAMRDIKNTESDNALESVQRAIAMAEKFPAIEILKPYYSPIVYNMNKRVDDA